jgi:predicted enzyme related to lactoylglutathione lyase
MTIKGLNQQYFDGELSSIKSYKLFRFIVLSPFYNDLCQTLIVFPLVIIVTSCNAQTNNNVKAKANSNKSGQVKIAMNDTTPKVTGIGGIFFTSENPKETNAWYGKNLGLPIGPYGSTFESRNVNKPDEINLLQWGLFKKGTTYFAPSKKEFMINYRVQNIEALVKKLKENGVTIVDNIETVEYGKFVHIMDPEGNKIELWEPVDSVLTKSKAKTTK